MTSEIIVLVPVAAFVGVAIDWGLAWSMLNTISIFFNVDADMAYRSNIFPRIIGIVLSSIMVLFCLKYWNDGHLILIISFLIFLFSHAVMYFMILRK